MQSRYDKALNQMQMWSGFFPAQLENGIKFKDLMISSIPQADMQELILKVHDPMYRRSGKMRRPKDMNGRTPF